MFQFENISLNNIVTFSDIMNNLSTLKKEFIKNNYSKTASHFEETVKFLKDLNLIKIEKAKILPTLKYKTFLNRFRKSRLQNPITRDFLLDRLLYYKTSITEYLNDYLSFFHKVGHQYVFIPTTTLRLKYKGLRNFLMDLEFIYLDSSKKKYIVSNKYSIMLTKFKESQLLSLHDFLKIREKKEKIGREAELQIITHEKNRLSQYPLLTKNIEHISIKDVQAGFDIKSFENKFDEKGDPIPRYIEVKAVSPWDYNFFWSRNEIEKAKLYKKQYYLYLLPVTNKKEFNLNALKIISDPYSWIYKKESEWLRTDELLSFSLA